MKLTVIGSGSAGNCYVFEGRRSALILECGIAPEKVFRSTEVKPSQVAGCLITHEHGDHSKYARKFSDLGMTLYASSGTLTALGLKDGPRCRTLQAMMPVWVGEWTVRPFAVIHDAQQPLGFIIEHPECGKILFITDTRYVPYSFKAQGLDHIMVEANYSDDILDDNVLGDRLTLDRATRVRHTHMSLRSACELVKANETAALKTVILLHLSEGNSDAERFAREAAKSALLAKVYVATAGLSIELNKNAF